MPLPVEVRRPYLMKKKAFRCGFFKHLRTAAVTEVMVSNNSRDASSPSSYNDAAVVLVSIPMTLSSVRYQ
ncbi:hypothetical protein V6N12_068485 [Hibiscus sabdariffa]|uniref:Uncharacterized protein n=1 Tax=Hibiscus sabdariffa TaxID=183260 RepID=A0ABR2FQU9_9ROSI